MEKKTYIAPQMEIMEVETVEMIATSLGMYGDEVDSNGQLSRGNRDIWDDIW